MKQKGPKIIHPRRTVSEYLLSGLLKCDVCGKAMSGHSAKSGQFFYYRCANASKRGADECPGHWVPKSKIESFVIGKIRDCILDNDNLADLVRLTNEELELSVGSQTDRLKLLEKQLIDVESRLEHLYDALETGSFSSDELAPRIRKMQAKRDEIAASRSLVELDLQSEIGKMPELTIIQEYVDDLKSLLSSSPILEQRTFLKSFIEEIRIGKELVTIDYSLPMPPDNSHREVVGVLPFVTNGRPCRIKGRTKTFSATFALVY